MLTSNIFNKIQEHFSNIRLKKINDLFQSDKNRFNEFTYEIDEMLVDLSKNLITKETINLFVELGKESDLEKKIAYMFQGEKVNFTENRSVSHFALRDLNLKELDIDNKNYSTEIDNTRTKMYEFSKRFRNGEILGITGKSLNTVVNIGIGGSYLGSAMACNALQEFDDKNIKVHFISNVDYSNLLEVFSQIDIERTLFIVASKTFTTSETLQNANTLKKLLTQYFSTNDPDKIIQQHFVGVSADPDKAEEFGILKNHVFNFWDFVGGRFSVWSACGLSILLKIGETNFEKFLSGANIIDKHVTNTPLEKNIPFLLAAIGIWNNNVNYNNSYAIIPYDHRLKEFPKYIQQLEMESNGKSTNSKGHKIFYNTSPVIFGETGTDSQHSFFQLLHQGTQTIPCDFIGFINNNIKNIDSHIHQDILFGNMLAQAEALMIGKDKQELIKESKKDKSFAEHSQFINHKIIDGNKPTNILVFNSLTPKTLGMLCAVYEHKIIIQGMIWNINSFDQYGVELGKKLSKSIVEELQKTKQNELLTDDSKKINNEDSVFSSSTSNLINIYKSKKYKNE